MTESKQHPTPGYEEIRDRPEWHCRGFFVFSGNGGA